MNPFPAPESVLVMDNCRIHHTDTLQDVLNAAGVSFHLFLFAVIDSATCRDHVTVSPSIFTRFESYRRILLDLSVPSSIP